MTAFVSKRLLFGKTNSMKRGLEGATTPSLHSREASMAARRSVEARFRKWQVSEEATINHLVRSLALTEPSQDRRAHDAMTCTGLFVEDQIRKSWNNPVIGLAIF